MKIEVFGTGCARCEALARVAREAAEKLGVPFELAEVKEIAEFAKRGVIVTPALAIDGKLRLSGKVPDARQMTSILTSAIEDRRES